MDVIIQGHNLKVNQSLEEYARRKIGKLDRYLPNIRDVRIDLRSENARRGGNLVSAQITVYHSRGAIIRAEERLAGDITAAIDVAVDKVYRRIQRFKGKRFRKGRERFIATIEELDIAEDIPDIEEFTDEAEAAALEPEIPASPIERRKLVELMPLSEIEAIEQMELLGHAFFLFFNAEDNAINVIYRRDNGGYGLLVPNKA